MIYGIGEAFGKIILMGEHAVVYGAPAIAMPFFSVGVKCTVHSHEGDTYIQSICYDGPLKKSDNTIQGIKELIQVSLDYLEQPNHNLKFIIESLIPPQRGLGSSAAVSVAIVRALFDAYKVNLSIDVLNHLVNIAESIHHFNPSGLDSATILNEEITQYQKGNGLQSIQSNMEGFLIVGDSGIEGNTKEAVSEVKSRMDQHPQMMQAEIETISQLTFKGVLALQENNIHTLGYLMTQNHRALAKLGVSNEIMDHYVDVALEAGAFGAKLTGGGKGGCMIAIVDSIVEANKISETLKKEGMKETWIYNMKEVSAS